jgi:hypothetical protein
VDRAFKQMDEHKYGFRVAIKSGTTEVWQQLILFLFDLIQNFAIKKKRRGKTPPLYNVDFKVITKCFVS